MSRYQLMEDLFLLPTPAGVFHAVSSGEDEPIRRLLRSLLSLQNAPAGDIQKLTQWLGVADEQLALEILYQAQTMGLIQGEEQSRIVSNAGVGQELSNLIPALSSVGKGLLVDWNGFSLVRSGVDDETAEIISALSADLAAVQSRHARRLGACLGLSAHGWGAIDAYGSSRIGVWPLYVGDKRFLLVLFGTPRLNTSEFVSLIGVLFNRYGKS